MLYIIICKYWIHKNYNLQAQFTYSTKVSKNVDFKGKISVSKQFSTGRSSIPNFNVSKCHCSYQLVNGIEATNNLTNTQTRGKP